MLGKDIDPMLENGDGMKLDVNGPCNVFASPNQGVGLATINETPLRLGGSKGLGTDISSPLASRTEELAVRCIGIRAGTGTFIRLAVKRSGRRGRGNG